MAESGSSALRFAYKGSRLKPLRAFCQVARLGSVSRAAEALYLSQPAVTLQLQALERELGVRLLERSGKRLTPTREGELLYEMAKPLVEGLDGLARTAAALLGAAQAPAPRNENGPLRGRAGVENSISLHCWSSAKIPALIVALPMNISPYSRGTALPCAVVLTGPLKL